MTALPSDSTGTVEPRPDRVEFRAALERLTRFFASNPDADAVASAFGQWESSPPTEDAASNTDALGAT
jgi:hypothetical protein